MNKSLCSTDRYILYLLLQFLGNAYEDIYMAAFKSATKGVCEEQFNALDDETTLDIAKDVLKYVRDNHSEVWNDAFYIPEGQEFLDRIFGTEETNA